MAATEPRMATRFAVQAINTNAPLAALIASGKAWQVIPRSVDTTSKPGVVVGVQSASRPTDLLYTGARVYSEQSLLMRVQVQQTTTSTQQIEAVEAAILALLDGQAGVAVSGGTILHCLFAGQLPDVPEDTGGDLRTLTSTLLFEVSAKCS